MLTWGCTKGLVLPCERLDGLMRYSGVGGRCWMPVDSRLSPNCQGDADLRSKGARGNSGRYLATGCQMNEGGLTKSPASSIHQVQKCRTTHQVERQLLCLSNPTLFSFPQRALGTGFLAEPVWLSSLVLGLLPAVRSCSKGARTGLTGPSPSTWSQFRSRRGYIRQTGRREADLRPCARWPANWL